MCWGRGTIRVRDVTRSHEVALRDRLADSPRQRQNIDQLAENGEGCQDLAPWEKKKIG